ncbi:U3 small nucleolar RNA-associated protein 14 homolog A [Carassius carassius]|uniref:U3 small nucleolar RNA-associated protein 14 homolog A n=1 Tax=Carassius carassius TaxID=217509 RepID=UPI002868C274|nr:U3 small nucleolar RNA-associated protein 14 homolog A [Carassius carassius]XP_059400423.1 U3 small nucleolar RNA-associated protein 14 homolog A [Carassius carassius]XP_059400430.1 U3 small nucleolar RNA-associated protein 14 homolog A [Carassius carassius]
MAADEEELSINDQAISASEDEEGSDDERKHKKLLEAISSMGGRKRKKQNERSEASVQVSEYFVNAEGTGDKVNLSDLLGTVEKTSGASNKTKKQLRNLQSSKGTLELPLNKQQTEKIQRGIAYEKTTTEVSCWKNIILQNQKAEQMVFPLNQESSAPRRVEQVVAGWKVQTPLEQEIFRLLHGNSQPVNDPVLTPVEEQSLKAMSLEEAKIRRAELQKARALQSYYEAKAKRTKKIKSKKFHKVQNKAKRKDFLKQFDEMVKTNPEGALEELKKMELSRMEERMSLKHQNSGKWAKSKAIMAKYDDSARKAMQEQLQMNKDLTQKIVVPSDDEHESVEEELETVPDFMNDPEPVIDPVNPWMRGQLTHEEPEVSCVPSEDVQAAGEENEEEEELIGAFERKRKLRQADEEDLIPAEEEQPASEVVEASDEEEDDDDDEDEEEDVSEFNTLFRLMRSEKTLECSNQTREGLNTEDEEGLLNEGQIRVRNIEDLEVLDEVVDGRPVEEPSGTPSAAAEATSEAPLKKRREISLKEVLTKEAKAVKVPFLPTVVDEEERDEQISIIKEAFAGDDVISDFIKDKSKQEASGRPEVVDLTLPGWGEWGGVGLKPSRWKRKRFRIQMAPPPPRQDQKLPDVIISEKRNSSVASHQVSHLPFPFQNTAQFESTIRTPIGPTWNTQSVVKSMTKPKVITQMGAIIEPMVKEDYIKHKSTAPGGKGPAIMLGGNRRAREGTKQSSEKRRGRRSQKRKKSQA